ncbi:Anterior gradient protein 2-like protein [Camelus dromedarius]|uniref:Anterior gradient protein 2-like protein n=1 Tax=Camelus dromedarius TaxID=9838 RepID=A0A5N4DYA4_CAMDR|nr:Anterior gradient protein 2-like protein [Camelus dromedarius]
MEKISVSAFLLLVALSYTLAKDTTIKPGAKKDTKNSGLKLPQTLSRGRSQLLVTSIYNCFCFPWRFFLFFSIKSVLILDLPLLFNSFGSENITALNVLVHFVLGWGDQLIWTQTYEEALFKSKTSNKPLMIIHHLDECPHSQALKKVFAENKDIQKLAEQFVLLNLVYETTDKHLSPDGQYVPRIMFVDPSLTVRADITGRYSNRLYAYEPSDTALLLDNMKKALILLKTEL